MDDVEDQTDQMKSVQPSPTLIDENKNSSVLPRHSNTNSNTNNVNVSLPTEERGVEAELKEPEENSTQQFCPVVISPNSAKDTNVVVLTKEIKTTELWRVEPAVPASPYRNNEIVNNSSIILKGSCGINDYNKIYKIRLPTELPSPIQNSSEASKPNSHWFKPAQQVTNNFTYNEITFGTMIPDSENKSLVLKIIGQANNCTDTTAKTVLLQVVEDEPKPESEHHVLSISLQSTTYEDDNPLIQYDSVTQKSQPTEISYDESTNGMTSKLYSHLIRNTNILPCANVRIDKQPTSAVHIVHRT